MKAIYTFNMEHIMLCQGEEEYARKVVADLDKKFDRLRGETNKDEVTKAMRAEAWEPTKDAIKVCDVLRDHVTSSCFPYSCQTLRASLEWTTGHLIV
jgi:vacuolar-type H+-ATPase subunit I/STV1